MSDIYKTRWILPANGEVIKDSAIITENGRIIDIIHQEQIEDLSDINSLTDYKNAVITPGFINLHTHLQFTNLEKDSDYENFTGWILDLIEKYSKWSISEKIKSLKKGVEESLLSGTTCIVQISGETEFFEVLNNLDIRSYIFLETFSGSKETSIIEFNKLKEKINIIEQNKKDNVNVGISPHSLYNVHSCLWKKIAHFASENNYLVQTHLAESQEEMEWIKKGSSDIDLIHKFIGWNKVNPYKTGLDPVDYLEEQGILEILNKNLILAHLNQMDSFKKLGKYNTGIVHCPRSNTILHGKTLDINKPAIPLNLIGVGTDSKYSNDDLNLLNEIKFIKNSSGLDLLKLLDMITINAARILRLDDKIGSLEEGKEADFLVFLLNNNESYNDLINKKTPDNVYIKGKQVVQNKELVKKS